MVGHVQMLCPMGQVVDTITNSGSIAFQDRPEYFYIQVKCRFFFFFLITVGSISLLCVLLILNIFYYFSGYAWWFVQQ